MRLITTSFLHIPWIFSLTVELSQGAAQNGWYPSYQTQNLNTNPYQNQYQYQPQSANANGQFKPIASQSQNNLNCGSCPPGTQRQVQQSSNLQYCGQCVAPNQSCAQGNVLVGNQCQSCPCPGNGERRFGTSCKVDTDGQITCDCSSEYSGRDCSQCAPGAIQNNQYPYNCLRLNSTSSQAISCPAGNICQPQQVLQVVTYPQIQPPRPQIQCPNPGNGCSTSQCPVQPQPQPTVSPWYPQPQPLPAPCPVINQPGPGPILCPLQPQPQPIWPGVPNPCPLNPNPIQCPVQPGPCPPCPVNNIDPIKCPAIQCPIPQGPCPPCPQPPTVICPTPERPQPCPTPNCPSPCPTLPTIPSCPTVNCPSPCPTLPTIPACPQCPQICPQCPAIPPCNNCPNPCPPCESQPCANCPSPCQRCPDQYPCPKCELTCNCSREVGPPGDIIFPVIITPCICDPRGTIAQYESNCYCKPNVQGYHCDTCKPGYFALSTDRPEGCLQCWGSGVSTYCTAAMYYRTYITTSRAADSSIELTDERNTIVYNSESSNKFNWNGNEARFSLAVSTRMFWILPAIFKGNRLTSYGGLLRFSRMFTGSGASLGGDNDIMIVGGNGATLYWSSFQTQTSGDWKSIEVPLDESVHWAYFKGGLSRTATRFDILEVLADIQMILIRATFTTSTFSTSLKDVSMGSVSLTATSEGFIFVIEHARCPFGYQGLSCESCSAGFFRDTTDMTASVFGACKLCPCGHNADGCHISYGEIKCKCKPGYTGDRCQSREVITVTLDPFWIREIEGAEVDYVCTFTTNSKRTLKMRLGPESSIGKENAEEVTTITKTYKLTKDLSRIKCEILDASNTVWALVYGAIILEQIKVVTLLPPKTISIVVNNAFICVNQSEKVTMTADVNQYGSRMLAAEWRKEGKPGLIRTGKTFEIQSARLDDSGTYIVSATDGDVTAAEKIVLVVRPRDNSIQGDEPLLIEGSNYYPINNRTLTKILNNKTEDEKAKEKSKSRGPPSILNSMQGDQPPEGYPSVVVEPQEIRVQPGETVTLRCNASGEEPMKFYWKSGSSEYIPVHVRVSRGALIFKSVRKEDSGSYYCIAWNNYGQVSAKASIIVEDKLEKVNVTEKAEVLPKEVIPLIISISRQHINSTPGGNVYFQCSTNNPNSKIQWTRKNGNMPTSSEVLENGTLVIYRVSNAEAGSYICTATGESGQKAHAEATLDLGPIVPPVVPSLTLNPKSPLKVRSGDKVRVDCFANGYPTPTVKWSKSIEGTSDKILVSSETNTTIYEITHAIKSDEGKYTCVATNEAGSKSESWSLNVDDAIICKSNEFRCKSGDQCVSKEDRCDGERDCKDGSDEHHCRKRSRRSPNNL